MRSFLAIAAALPAVFLAAPVGAQQPEAEKKVEFNQLQEALQNARPAPALGLHYPASESDVPERHSRMTVDLTTGKTSFVPPDFSGVGGAAFRAGREPLPLWRIGGLAPPPTWRTDAVDGDPMVERGKSSSCTPPARFLLTHDVPWQKTYKLVMRFHVAGTDYYYSCSASAFGPFHLLTAGHCIFNRDPNDDGDTSDGKWADEVWAWGAQTDVVNPFGEPDFPFGVAKATVLDTYTGWFVDGDFNYDIGYIALDRWAGDQTGWLGREADLTTTQLNFNGYPTETPYVPDGELAQYHHSDPGNVLGYTTNRIQMCAYVYGGHSGGPVWRYHDGLRHVQGVNSTSTREGYAEATRLTAERLGHMDGRIANDGINAPPVARPDLIEYVFSYADDTKDVSPNFVLQDHVFFVKYSLINSGFANSGEITVDFYLSDNNTISSYDNKVGTATLGAIDPGWLYIVPDWPLLASVGPGTYWVGWIMRSAVPEYGGDFWCTTDPCSNVVVVADETLTVGDCSDGWENDDGWSTASHYSPGVPQNHDLCPIGDLDWVSFSLSQPSAVVLETFAAAGDTEMWLYNSGLGLIEYDNNDGGGNLSRIDRQCGAGQLGAGTYYVQIGEYGNDQVVDGYTISVDATPCDGSLIFSDGFESGNTAAWSTSVP
jgi:V8-like Glu-specific endopeptidase